jgi:tetratricopeptide (TPR) repeat protein
MRVTLLVFLFAALVAASAPAAAPTLQGGRVLVLPFDNVNREGRLYWLSEAAAVLLTDELRSAGADIIGRDERLEAFEQLQLPPSASLSDATVIRVGQLVGAAYVVVGSFTAAANDLSVKARAIRLDSGRLEADLVGRGAIAELFRIFADLARQLRPSSRSPGAASDFTQAGLPVFEAYIKGLVAESPAARVRFLSQALETAPRFDRARLALWKVHTAQGEHDRAVAAVAQVPEASPVSRRARFLSSLSRIRLKQYDEAFSVLKALADQQAAPAIFNNLGVVQSRRPVTPQTGKATYYFNKAVEADPADPDYAFNLGYAYWMDRDSKATVYWLNEAVRRNPGDGEAHFILGMALTATGAGAEGEREKELARQISSTFREWERRASGGDPVPRGLERLREDLDAPRLGLVDTTLAPGEQQNQQELAAFHLERAKRRLERQQESEALHELRRSLYLDPYQAEALLLLGRLHLEAGRVQDAIVAFKVSIWSRPTVEAHVALGEAYLQAGDQLLARTEADRALTLDPSAPSAKALRSKLGPKLLP